MMCLSIPVESCLRGLDFGMHKFRHCACKQSVCVGVCKCSEVVPRLKDSQLQEEQWEDENKEKGRVGS